MLCTELRVSMRACFEPPRYKNYLDSSKRPPTQFSNPHHSRDWPLHLLGSMIMDHATAALILACQLSDAEEILQNERKCTGASRGTVGNAVLAFLIYREELRRSQAVLLDQQIAHRLGGAIEDDERPPQRAPTNPHSPSANPSSQDHPEMEGERIKKLVGQSVLVEIADSEETADVCQSSVTATRSDIGEDPSSRGHLESVNNSNVGEEECIACAEIFWDSDILQAPCSHFYCQPCTARFFQSTLDDNSHFPPSCCGRTWELPSVSASLGPELTREVEEKLVEHATVNRTYCAQPACSTFIPPEGLGDQFAVCPACEERTCIACKHLAHWGDCQDDPGLDALLNLAGRARWQRCFNCYSMVELRDGCNHIT